MSNRSGDAVPREMVGNATFVIYCIYIVDYYVRISARVPGLAAIRPTLLLFASIVVLLIAQRNSLRGRLTTRPARALLVLLIYLAVSLPFTTWPGSAIHNFEPFARAVAFFYFTVLIVDTDRRLFVFLWVLVCCQLFRVLEPLYLNITTGYLGDSTYLGGGEFAGRLAGAPHDVINPNGLGFVAVTCIPYLYYCVFAAKQLYRKGLALALMGACLYVVMLTLSRGAMVALVVVLWIIFLKSKHKVLIPIVATALCAIGWAHLDAVHKDRYMSLFSKESRQSASAEGRLQLDQLEFEIGMQRPIFGHGLGTTAEAKVHDGHRPQASHNVYTELLIEIGVVGAFFFLRFLFSLYAELRLATRRLAEDKERSDEDIFSRLILCFTALFWMYAVFSSNYFGLSEDYWYVLAGLVTVLASSNLGSTKMPVSSGSRP
jgi:O-antigen ligase